MGSDTIYSANKERKWCLTPFLFLKGASIVGVFWGEFAKREPQQNMKGMAEMLGWMREVKLKPLISKSYTLADAPQALMDMAARKVVGKIVIAP